MDEEEEEEPFGPGLDDLGPGPVPRGMARGQLQLGSLHEALADARHGGEGGEPGATTGTGTRHSQSDLSINFPAVEPASPAPVPAFEPAGPAPVPAAPELADFIDAWKRELEAAPDDDSAGCDEGAVVDGGAPAPPEEPVEAVEVAGFGQTARSIDPDILSGYAERVEEQSAKLALALQLHLEAERVEAEGGRMHEAMLLCGNLKLHRNFGPLLNTILQHFWTIFHHFWTSSHAFLASMPLCARRALCCAQCPC